MSADKDSTERLRAEIRSIRGEFAVRLKAAREAAVAAGVNANAFLATTALFDGPAPEPLGSGVIAAGAGLFPSSVEMLRSIRFPPAGEMCEIAPGDGGTSRAILDRCFPRTLHLFERRFDRLDPAVRGAQAVRLHEGDPADLVRTLADESLDYAVVDGTVSHAATQRLFEGLLPKVRRGGFIHVRNYTSWSVFSGIPYGVAAIVNGLVNGGALRLVGLVPNQFGYHQVLLRKGDAPLHGMSDGAVGVSPLAVRAAPRSPLLAPLPRTAATVGAEPPAFDTARAARIAARVRERIPPDAAVLVVGPDDPGSLGLEGRRAATFPLDAPGLAAADPPEEAAATISRFQHLLADGWTHLVVSAGAFEWLDRHGEFSGHLRRSCGLVSLDADSVMLSLVDPSPWADLDALVQELGARLRRQPAILDWGTGQELAAALPDLPVFTPPATEGGRLPYIDASVDVVAVPAGDAARMDEARRVATAAVVEIDAAGACGVARVAVHRLAAPPERTVDANGAPPRSRPLADRRILICSHFLPQPECDSYSRRLFHFVRFLREAGCEVTCMADSGAGREAFVGLLDGQGVRTIVGLDPQQVAAVARDGLFDWALLGYWHMAAPLIAPLRSAAPATRLIIDSGDVHFLRAARTLLRDADGMQGHLDATFAGAAAREIDAYAAADGVLTVSRKEADLVADLLGDSSRSFAVPDSEDLPPSPLPFEERRGMLFVGNFGHPPNAEALHHLCQRILPHLDPALLTEHPLSIVGSNMPESLRAATHGLPGVRTVGWVPSIVPWLERTRVSLIPLLNGAGTKRKMIQSLAIGTPTVTTTVGLEGFSLADEREVLVADDPVDFASGITRLLTDGDLWRRLAGAGLETIRREHSHEAARERLLAALERVRTAPHRRRSQPVAVAAGGEPVDVPFRGLAAGQAVIRPAAAAGRAAPRISVVIPTRDRAPLLREALESLVGQSADRDSFEVVVVNDGSTDATAEVCDVFAGWLRLARVDTPPSGIGRAKNIGIDVAAAPLLLSFDDDDVADPGLVAAHLAAHERYPLEHVAVLGFTDWHERLAKTEVMRFVTDVGHYLFNYTFLRDGQVLDHTWFWGGRSSCKKSLLVRAGGFRPDFTFGSEDIEAGYRISRMVARERGAAGAGPDGVGLAVVFRRDAVQHVIRPMTYDEFCRRCERQGRSQWQFSRFYDDPSVQAWCRVDGAAERWDQARDLLAERVARVHELEAILASAAAGDRAPLLDELHALYRWTFDAFKAKGIVEESGGADALHPRRTSGDGPRR